MKKLTALFVFALLVSGITAASAADNKQVIGTWKYIVSSAPEGLDKGEVVISEKESILVGKVVFLDGNSVVLQNVKYEKGELTFGLYVETNYVSVKAKVNLKKMEGQVNTPDGFMDFVAELAENK